MDDAEPNAEETEFPDNIAWWLELPPDGFIDSIVGAILHDLNRLILPINEIERRSPPALESPVLADMTLREVLLEMRGNADHINEMLKLATAYKEKLRQENNPSDSTNAE